MMRFVRFLGLLTDEIRAAAWDDFVFTVRKADHPYVVCVVQWQGSHKGQLFTHAKEIRIRDLDLLPRTVFDLLESARKARTEAAR